MSELAKTIDRLEQWVDYWEPHQPAEFIADLRAQQAQVLADGYLFWGQADDTTSLEAFALEMEGQT